MLKAIWGAVREIAGADQVSDQETDQVKKLLALLEKEPLSASGLMHKLGLSHRPTFRNNYLHPALDRGLIEMTIPDKPRSRLQRYRITPKGILYIKPADRGD
jgi:hypothetical protein